MGQRPTAFASADQPRNLIPLPAPSDRSYSDAAINRMIGREIFSPEQRQSAAKEQGTGTRAIGPCLGQLAGIVT